MVGKRTDREGIVGKSETGRGGEGIDVEWKRLTDDNGKEREKRRRRRRNNGKEVEK